MFSGLTTYLVQWSSNLAAAESASVNYISGLSQAGHVGRQSSGNINRGARGPLQQIRRPNQDKKNFNKRLCVVCGEKYTSGHFCPRYCMRCSQYITKPCRCPTRKAALNNISMRAYSTAMVPPSGKGNSEIVPPNDDMTLEEQELPPSSKNPTKMGIATKMANSTMMELLQQKGTCHPGEDVTKQEKKLTFSFIGSIEGKTVRILMDSGAEDDFISESFVRTHGLPGQGGADENNNG